MAIVYATGSALRPDDLIDKIRVALIANAAMGWVIDGTTPHVNGGIEHLHVSNPEGYWHIWCSAGNDQYIYMSVNSSFVSAGVAGGGEIAGVDARSNLLTGPYLSYHFFIDPKAFRVVLELNLNEYSHLMFGSITKYGTWTGGQFAQGMNWTDSDSTRDQGGSPYHDYPYRCNSTTSGYGYNHITANEAAVFSIRRFGFDTSAPWDYPVGGCVGGTELTGMTPVEAGNAYTNPTDWWNFIQNQGQNVATGRTPMVPTYVFMRDGSYWVPLGEDLLVKALNIEAYTPKQVVDTDWMVFPLKTKKPYNGDDTFSSDMYGIAYKFQ
ncbi:MAG: hypothetical protein OEX12_13260 [Gammaproteobacteria bacterium]|nr:hypothetical protein [Gammaproteobacteria bacterium]